MNRFFIIIFCLIIFPVAHGQDVKVTSEFDTSRIFIGDQINFKITVDQPLGIKLDLPYFRDTLVKNIEILSGPLVDSSKKDGRVLITEKYLITSFDSGFYHIPPVFAEIKNENGLKRFFSDNARLEVMRTNVAPADTTAKIYDIIEPYRAPVTLGEILPWVLLAGLAAALIWLAIVYIRKLRKPKDIKEEVINPDPAHVIAFRELERLKEEQLWQRGEIKSYYSSLTEILRKYLENRYEVYSLELTTSETLDALFRKGFKKDNSYNQLRSVLTVADLVKFAKYKPGPEEHEAHFQHAWEFVDTTKVVETTEPGDKGNTVEKEVKA